MSTVRPPDFEEMTKLASKIGQLTLEKLSLDNEISAKEAASIVTAIAMSGDKKPPSMEYLKLTVKYTGINGEILPLRSRLVQVTSSLEEAKLTFQVYRDIVSIYQTESSNKRAGLL